MRRNLRRASIFAILVIVALIYFNPYSKAFAHGEEDYGHLLTTCVETIETETHEDKSRVVKYFVPESGGYYYNTIPNIVTTIEIEEILIPCILHASSHRYLTYVVPEWSGVLVEEDTPHIKTLNGSYTVLANGLVRFNALVEGEPLWYSMQVHRDGSVAFNGRLTINEETGMVIFNGQQVGILVHRHIIWIHDLWLVAMGY